MPTPSAIDNLSPEQRTALNTEIERRNFADYDGLVAWLAEQGLELARSTVARQGQKLKKRLQQVKDATEGARMIAQSAPDDADLRSAAVISMIQSELFNIMVSLQELDEDTEPADRLKLLKEASQSLNHIAKSSLSQKQFEQEIRKQERDKALKEASVAMKQAGISEDVEQSIRDILTGKAS